ncbi:MAG: NAD(P)-binding domain-containing protein [Acidobacteriota bacterium]
MIYLTFFALLMVSIGIALWVTKRREQRVRLEAEAGKLYSHGPRAQHPRIDVSHCIGCGVCTEVCPEGNVLGLIGGKAAIINGHKCIGHGVCAEACPVGAIEIVNASPSINAEMPRLSETFETSVPGIYIVGELGGLALIKNAINQGRECIDTIAQRLGSHAPRESSIYDVCIVGAGPGGISASLRAVEQKLSYITLEQDELGGTVAKYPRRKLVMTSPVELPLYGKFKKREISKEELVALWNELVAKARLKVNTKERVLDVLRGAGNLFTIHTTSGSYRARTVVLALGRRGTPRKLGIEGEELPKVMYSLIETEAYINSDILVVGGGDSAVEAAMGLAHQTGNRVTLSYRKDQFGRIKQANAERLKRCVDKQLLTVMLNSVPLKIGEKSVILEVSGKQREIPNDYVWVFAGGTPPTEFLEKIGIGMGMRDMTQDAFLEARESVPRAKAAP